MIKYLRTLLLIYSSARKWTRRQQLSQPVSVPMVNIERIVWNVDETHRFCLCLKKITHFSIQGTHRFFPTMRRLFSRKSKN